MKAIVMAKRITGRPTTLALVLACALSPMAVLADQPDPSDFVVSQDQRYMLGQVIPADQVPTGIRTISYAQYVAQQRTAGLTPRSINALRNGSLNWSIGVFR